MGMDILATIQLYTCTYIQYLQHDKMLCYFFLTREVKKGEHFNNLLWQIRRKICLTVHTNASKRFYTTKKIFTVQVKYSLEPGIYSLIFLTRMYFFIHKENLL